MTRAPAPIGRLRAERHTCSGGDHLANCYNPGLGLTACVCGERWWRGHAGTWHSRRLRGEVTATNALGSPTEWETVGWDRYFLHAPGCRSKSANPRAGHVCGGLESITAAEAFGRTSPPPLVEDVDLLDLIAEPA